LTYTPPAATQTKFGGTQLAAADTVSYRICYAGSSICSAVVTVSIDVTGTTSFAGIHTSMNVTGGCTGSCHEGTNAAAGRWKYSIADAKASASDSTCLPFAAP
jgi:hypothetical protein